MKNALQKIKKYIILLLISSFLLISFPVFSATLDLKTINSSININDTITLDIYLTTDKYINAVLADLNYSKDLLEVQSINTANSIINVWINYPKDNINFVHFSGIIPGGFEGENGQIFKITFKAKNNGRAKIFLSNIQTLQNDGEGSNVLTSSSPTWVNINNRISNFKVLASLKGSNAPEIFSPQITKSPYVFKNKWFVVFEAQDKNSGIKKYEILEKRPGVIEIEKWYTVTSPYILKDQKLKSNVSIKAIDWNNNERIVVIPAQNQSNFYDNFPLILTFLIILYYAIYKKMKNKK